MSAWKNKFNTTISEFIDDLLILRPKDKDLQKMSTLTSVSNVDKNIFIKNFQVFFLKDIFVKAVLLKDVDFFINYDFSQDEKLNKIKNDVSYEIFIKIQTSLKEIKGTKHENDIFKWMTLLIYYAYSDLNINATEIFQSILSKKNE